MQIPILCPANDLLLVPHVKFLNWFDTGIVRNIEIDAHSTTMHKGLAHWINLGFLCHMPSVTKNRVFCIGPLPRPNEPYNFYVRWHRILKFVMFIDGGRGRVPAKKFGLLATARATRFVDRLLAHTQQAFAHTPKKQRNNNKICADWDYNQSHALS